MQRSPFGDSWPRMTFSQVRLGQPSGSSSRRLATFGDERQSVVARPQTGRGPRGRAWSNNDAQPGHRGRPRSRTSRTSGWPGALSCLYCSLGKTKRLSNDSMDSQDLTLLNFKRGEHSHTHKPQESCDIMRPTLKEFLRPYEPSTGAKLRVR